MKGLQGERLRQAFKYFDQDQDGLIKPDQFKRIILVSFFNFDVVSASHAMDRLSGTCWS